MNEIKPLFVPGPSVRPNYNFVCNIADELSLWRQRDTNTFRVYNKDSRGAYLQAGLVEDPIRGYEEVVEGNKPYDLGRPTVDLYRTIVKHKEALTVYMAMLSGVR
jgi:hypothetical protein